MGGWGELRGPRDAGAGTSGQIEQAHDALDAVGIHPGPLAVRALAAAEKLDRVAPVAELAEGLYRSGALDGIIVADVRFAELVGELEGQR